MKATSTQKKINLPIDQKKSSLRYYTKSILAVLVFMIGSSLIHAQNSCKSKLQVEKNRNSRSISSEGTQYRLLISNETSNQASFNLKAIDINKNCTNNDGSSTSNNVNLNFFFTDVDSNPISDIVLNSGETKSFLVKLTIPSGTPYNRWNCTEIAATSNDCSNYSITTILHTLVSDPNQE
ncbi:hypothetical protein SAMN05444143_1122 [Flavobacterium succinicans]|uniref:Fn3-like domain-containing protein n=1 Tax=Flavobacterium succinicans TaxID=29536 RepID=A0A1I4YKA9_9FLAO|nr:hypothetical protein [Flavobacterium succinicans]SFN38407.1 hypothetical protein SAMN05444143_1122 [Flavobacterium succinicans]